MGNAVATKAQPCWGTSEMHLTTVTSKERRVGHLSTNSLPFWFKSVNNLTTHPAGLDSHNFGGKNLRQKSRDVSVREIIPSGSRGLSPHSYS